MWDNEPKYTIHSSHGLLFQIFMYLVHLNIPPITPGGWSRLGSRYLGLWLKCKQKFDILRTSHWLGARAVNESSQTFTVTSRVHLLVECCTKKNQ